MSLLRKSSIPTLGLLFSAAHLSAQVVIYSDSFTNTDGTVLLGLAPESGDGVPGATYHESNNFWTTNSPVGIFNNRAQLGADNQANLPIASTPDFVQPEKIGVSIVLNLGTTAPHAVPDDLLVQRGVGLGFFAGTSNLATPDDFRGLMITTEGRLILAQHGLNGLPRAGIITEIATDIDISIDHSLSFEIDTTTGDISNIRLDGDDQPDVETDIFAANINHVGFMVSSNSGGTLATYDDLWVYDAGAPGPRSAPAITSIKPVDATNFEITVSAAPNSIYVLMATDDLNFDNATLLDGFTQGNVDDPGGVGPDGNVVITDENGNATLRFPSTGSKNFIRLEQGIIVVGP